MFTNNNNNKCNIYINIQHTYLYIVFIMYKSNVLLNVFELIAGLNCHKEYAIIIAWL